MLTKYVCPCGLVQENLGADLSAALAAHRDGVQDAIVVDKFGVPTGQRLTVPPCASAANAQEVRK